MAPKPRSPEERFWPKVNKRGPVSKHRRDLGRCWLWTGLLDKDGYGRHYVGVSRATAGEKTAHRFAYELLVGPVPDGLELDHLCRIRNCVNPRHLEPVTTRVNQLRGFGLSGHNARKTHCPNGHPYDEANTIWSENGTHRTCRICRRETWRRYNKKRWAEQRR